MCVSVQSVAGGRTCVARIPPPRHHEIQLVNARAVCILLECILVLILWLRIDYVHELARTEISERDRLCH